MSSKEIYDLIYSNNIIEIESGDIAIDDYLTNDRKDTRMGVSLILPIHFESILYYDLINELKNIESNQYYYPIEDLHITIFDFIKGNANYIRDTELEKVFLKVAEEAIKGIRPFTIFFKGIVSSNGAVIIQGYDSDILLEIRESIRAILTQYGLVNDERYRSESAHITFMRFKNKLIMPNDFCEYIRLNRAKELGCEHVMRIDLVEHDWYNRKATKRVIGSLKFRKDS